MNQAMIIDDDEDYRNLLVRKLSRSFDGIRIEEIDPLSMPLPDESYPWEEIDFIILDYHLGNELTGLDWYKRFRPERMPATILLTARGSEEIAVRAMKLGIDDYIVKEHFDNETLTDSINECAYNKKMEQAKLQDLTHRSVVFNKSSFMHRLGLITRDKDTRNHLLVFNPVAYQQIGRERGISSQDTYINYVADIIYQYLSSHHVVCNIFIYREEYIAVILETGSHEKYLKGIYKKLEGMKKLLGSRKYPCSVSVGVINPRNLEPGEVNKSDFELLFIAQVLCDSAATREEDRICNYGDINMQNPASIDSSSITPGSSQSIDIESALDDGRVSANYQPWVYISTEETINLKDIYDVRIEIIDFEGNRIAQRDLLGILDNAYSKRIVDRWVIRNTVSQLARLAEKSGKQGTIKLASKVTLSSVSDPGFIAWLKDLLVDAVLPKGSLLFEIESVQYLRDPDQYWKLFNEIGKRYDIKFVLSGIDQIETYHQIREARRFDYVKLNVKDLIHGFPRGPLNDLIETIREDNSKIVAIHVADAETLSLVAEFDVDYVHGYLVGKPDIDVITDSEGDLYAVI